MPRWAATRPTEFTKQIDLYLTKIRQVESRLEVVNPAYFEQFPLLCMCLVHELFHHLERKKNGSTGRLVWIQVKVLGIVPARRYLEHSSEIAAHTFVKRLLNLNFNTYAFEATMTKLARAGSRPGPGAEQGHPVPVN